MNTQTQTLHADRLPAASQRALMAAIVLFAAIVPTILMTAPAIATQLATQWQLSPSQIGDLFSTELGAMSLATLPAFWWLKRISWRRAAVGAGALFIVSNLLSIWAPDYPSLLALRFCSALGGGSLMIICLSSAASTANPSRVYGLWVMGQLVVGTIGLSILPRLFEHYGLAACYVILAALMTLLLPLARYFPEGAPVTEKAAEQGAQAPRWKISLGILGVLGFYISLSGVWTFIGAISAKAGISAELSGEILALSTAMGIVGAGCASLIGNRLPRQWLLMLSYSVMAGSVLLLLGQPQWLRFALAALAFKFTWTFILPLILACLADLDRSGKLMNATNLVIGGGLAVGPAVAGRLIEASGDFQWLLVGGACITLLSLLLILSCRPKV